jgi:hypothetical protein
MALLLSLDGEEAAAEELFHILLSLKVQSTQCIHIVIEKLVLALLASQPLAPPASAMCIHMTCFGNG